MPQDTISSDPTEAPAYDEQATRLKAKRRPWNCSGSGLALIGYPKLAIATWAFSGCVFFAIIWLAVRPNEQSFWICVTAAAIASVFCVIEQLAVRRATLRPSGPRFLVGGYIATSCFGWIVAIIAIAFLVTRLGTFRMAGSGMSPTLRIGERLVYDKRVDWQWVRRDAIIVYKNADDSTWGKPGVLITARILAKPGDQLSIEDGYFLLNGKRGPKLVDTGGHATAMNVPFAPKAITVPEDCYFIVQNSGYDSRVLSWARKDRMVSSRLWYLSSRGLFKAME